MRSINRLGVLVSSISLTLLFTAAMLLNHAWESSHVAIISKNIQAELNSNQIVSFLDLQIQHAKSRLPDLDPGPPPPWFYPSYYYEWLPKAQLYAEGQETLIALQKQRREMLEQGKKSLSSARYVWNVGIAPILHLILAITLILTALRIVLRFTLFKGWFGWQVIED